MTGRRGLGVLTWLLAVAGVGTAGWAAKSWSWWSSTWTWLGRWWLVPVAVLLLVAAVIVGMLRARHPTSAPADQMSAEVMRPMTPRTILLGGLVLLGVGVTAAVVLLVSFAGAEPRDRLDAIRTAATLLVGTGGAAALLLAARRQRAAELTLAVQRKAAVATEHDAAERRITELYLKAVEQLGSDKAAVRHGGLYALERVAQDNPEHRQTVVNVLCAYLRSPTTTPPPEPTATSPATRRSGPHRLRQLAAERIATVAVRLASTNDTSLPTPGVEPSAEQRQEREVRLTAQGILIRHLTPNPADQPKDTFWASIDLDLTGATLTDFRANGLVVRQATFKGATFSGEAWFGGAHFTDKVWFIETKFTSNAWFINAKFTGGAAFTGAKFTGGALFDEVEFTGVWFVGTEFTSMARFTKTKFANEVDFAKATFTTVALMRDAQVQARSVGAAVLPTGWTVEDYHDETAVPETQKMLRFVPVSVVPATHESSDGIQG